MKKNIYLTLFFLIFLIQSCWVSESKITYVMPKVSIGESQNTVYDLSVVNTSNTSDEDFQPEIWVKWKPINQKSDNSYSTNVLAINKQNRRFDSTELEEKLNSYEKHIYENPESYKAENLNKPFSYYSNNSEYEYEFNERPIMPFALTTDSMWYTWSIDNLWDRNIKIVSKIRHGIK